MRFSKIINTTVALRSDITELDYEGAYINGTFECAATQITSLKGAPSYIEHNFNCNHTNITSLEGSPRYVGEDFNCSFTNITSLHNIHKHIKHIGGDLYLPDTLRSCIIGVMLIKGIQRIEIRRSVSGVPGAALGLGNRVMPWSVDEILQLDQAEDIVNKHLAGDRNIHDCQEELLEAGLGDYAKL